MPDDKPKKIMSDMVAAPMKRVQSTPLPKIAKREPSEVLDINDNRYHHRPVESSKSRSRYFLWVTAFVCMIALILGIGGLFSHGTVNVVPKEFSGDVNASVTFSKSHETGTVFFATAVKTFTDEIVVPAVSRSDQESKATGKVRFMNNNTVAKTIPAGTKIVSSKKIEYQTAKSFTIPGKKGSIPGQIDAGILAVESGSQANSDLDDFTFVNDKTFSEITVRSVTTITGGSKSSEAIADSAAITAATTTLQNRFPDAATLVKRLSESIPDGMIVLPISISSPTASISNEANHDDGVHVVISQTVGIVMARANDIAKIIAADVAKGEKAVFTIRDLSNLTFVANVAMSGQNMPEKITARISGTATVFGEVDTNMIRSKIVGLSRADAKKILQETPEIASFRLRLSPPWRRTLPASERDVDVESSTR